MYASSLHLPTKEPDVKLGVQEGVRLAVRLHLRKCMTGQDTMSEELHQIIALTKQCYEKMQKAGARQRVGAA